MKKDGGDVDAITASTITSRAFLRCVNGAYKALQDGASADCGSGVSKVVPAEPVASADSLQNDSTNK